MPTELMPEEATVRTREDRWVSVPCHTPSGFDETIQLRPGSDESKVEIRCSTVEVSFLALRRGLDMIEEEHAR